MCNTTSGKGRSCSSPCFCSLRGSKNRPICTTCTMLSGHFAFVAIFCASHVTLIVSVSSTLSNAGNVTNVQPARTTEERDRLAIVTSLNYRQVIKLLPVSESQQGGECNRDQQPAKRPVAAIGHILKH